MAKTLSKIEKLIAKLCPNGVEFKTLDQVCLSISAGGDLPEKYKKGQIIPTEDFPFPIYSNGTDEKALYGFTAARQFSTGRNSEAEKFGFRFCVRSKMTHGVS